MRFSNFSCAILISFLFTIMTIVCTTIIEVDQNHYGPHKNSDQLSGQNVTDWDQDVGDVMTSKIYKGTKAPAYPFMAIIVRITPLFNNAQAICGATILDENNLLTAAHCVTAFMERIASGDRFEAWIGGTDLTKRFLFFPPAFDQKIPLDRNRLFAHPNFISIKNQVSTDDIGILGLSRPILLRAGRVERICIGTRDYDGEPATAIGYGLSKCIKSESNQLLRTSGKVLNARKCVAAGHQDNLIDSQVCAQLGRWPFKSATGPGDSGGPLFGQFDGQFVQIGITSYGSLLPLIYCPITSTPSTFTRAGSFRQFIQMYAPGACFV